MQSIVQGSSASQSIGIYLNQDLQSWLFKMPLWLKKTVSSKYFYLKILCIYLFSRRIINQNFETFNKMNILCWI